MIIDGLVKLQPTKTGDLLKANEFAFKNAGLEAGAKALRRPQVKSPVPGQSKQVGLLGGIALETDDNQVRWKIGSEESVATID